MRLFSLGRADKIFRVASMTDETKAVTKTVSRAATATLFAAPQAQKRWLQSHPLPREQETAVE